MRLVASLAFAAVVAGAAAAQEPPAACRGDSEGMIDWQACAAVAAPGSNLQLAAEANLATFAYYDYDLEAAAAHFERTLEIMGPDAKGEPFLHALRGATFDAAGKEAESRRDLDIALEAADAGAVPDEALPEFYGVILPALYYGEHPRFADVRDRFLALPAANADALLSRAAVLGEIEQFDRAVADARQALAADPNDPNALGLACWLLVGAGLNQEAVATCAKADAASPGQPDVLADYAVALASAGRCREARSVSARLNALAPREGGQADPLVCEN